MFFCIIFKIIILICSILINKTFGNDIYYDSLQKDLLLKKLLNNFPISNPFTNINYDNIKFLQEKYKNSNNYEDNSNNENFSEIKMTGRIIDNFLIKFENSGSLENYDIIDSKLYITYDVLSNDKKNIEGKIHVYDVKSSPKVGTSLGSTFLHFDEYEKKDLTMIINLTKEYSHEYIKLGKKNLYMVIIPKTLNSFLNITITHADILMKVINKQNRKKRHDNEFSACENDISKDSCCMKSYEINFDDLKWDFIIAPRVIKTNYCYGECRKIIKKSTIGNVLSTMENENNINYRSCCHPIEYKPINVTVFINKSMVETKLINDLLVKKCSCY
ncbi:LD29161p [Strongyloides ratti]|uniref:LD29161p n=1 Tax=Strongyloides ratti TaxID=34506 RepID=A0A090MZF0_STRRB|nr:LD29161p [Strongyloides ratti]CEF68819.1 LD29161p [Strongyloides ratti]